MSVQQSSDFGSAFLALYEQLRAVARSRLAGADSVSLQATALVHEALLRLAGRPLGSFNDEAHLLATASQAIRHVIVDHLRAKKANKRGAGRINPIGDNWRVIDAMLAGCSDAKADLALDLDQVLQELAELDSELKVIVELHLFGGLPLVEIAKLMNCSERTVYRRWQFAAALLREKLESWNPSSNPLINSVSL